MKFDPENDIPALSSKVFLITGGTSGIGRETILTLAQHNPKRITFTGRNSKRAASVIEEAKEISPSAQFNFIKCGQTSLESVSSAAREVVESCQSIDVLICCAGVMAVKPALTMDGYEIQFGVNHLAHALFIKILIPLLTKTAEVKGDARIISVASLAAKHTPRGGIQFERLKTTQDDLGMTAKWMRYGQSKLANILYTSELAKHYPSLTVVSLEPGTAWTNLFSSLGLLDRAFSWLMTYWKRIEPNEASHNICWASTANRDLVKPGFYEPIGIPSTAISLDDNEKLATTLWDWTQEQLKKYG